jgi:hypothetical protein
MTFRSQFSPSTVWVSGMELQYAVCGQYLYLAILLASCGNVCGGLVYVFLPECLYLCISVCVCVCVMVSLCMFICMAMCMCICVHL